MSAGNSATFLILDSSRSYKNKVRKLLSTRNTYFANALVSAICKSCSGISAESDVDDGGEVSDFPSKVENVKNNDEKTKMACRAVVFILLN